MTAPAGFGPPAARSVRVGDAERDRAAAELADHFAAGRLTKQEYDERVAAALTATHERDLASLFVDLPAGVDRSDRAEGPRGGRPHPAVVGWGARPPVRGHALPGWPMLVLPVLVVGLVAVAASSPWVLFLGIWVACLVGGHAKRSRLRADSVRAAPVREPRSGPPRRPRSGRGVHWPR